MNIEIGQKIKLKDGTTAKVVAFDEEMIVAKTEFGTVYLTIEGLFKETSTYEESN